MIPKVLHYVWLGNGDMPRQMSDCINSWAKMMPDYEIVRWDEQSIQCIDSIFMTEAIKERKWAFASDVIRLYALYNYGGIYLDTDVIVYKSFDDLLSNKAFIGRENSLHIVGKSTINYLTTCCFGAEKGNKFIERCLNYYKDRHFITSTDISLPMELRLDTRYNSEIFCKLAVEIGYNPSVLANATQRCDGGILTIYPSSYFDSIKVYPHTYSKHLALGTWRNTSRKDINYTFKYKIMWRLRSVVEKLLARYDYIMIKLK